MGLATSQVLLYLSATGRRTPELVRLFEQRCQGPTMLGILKKIKMAVMPNIYIYRSPVGRKNPGSTQVRHSRPEWRHCGGCGGVIEG